MAKKSTPKHRTRIVSKRFAKGSRKVRGTISIVRSLRSPKSVRVWLGFSQSDMGSELARLMHKPSPFGKSTISEWESGKKPLSRSVIDVYGVLIANRVARLTKRPNDVGIKLEINSPWHISVWSWCDQCGSEFEIDRANQSRCPNCRK
ncbi:hypothetical protein BAC2_02922 [uncultured bacterium]|nr:hypothetical protein BAC2_02922 [uncultured bacterium]